MVALFGYGLPGRVMSSPGRGYVPGWQGYVVALLVESVPGQGGACPAGAVRARSRGCFLPGKRDLQDLTDLSDLSDLSNIQDIQDR